MTTQITLPDDIRRQMERAAAAEGKSVSELMAEAVARFLSHRELDHLFDLGRKYAALKPYTAEDVPRLVREIRSEQEQCGG